MNSSNVLCRTSRVALSVAFIPWFASSWAFSQQPPAPNPPTIAEASNEGHFALKSFRLAEGLEGNLFAAEPMVANPVAFYVTDQGRVFVCESFRQSKGVVDNRSYNEAWVDADLAAVTIEDRRQYFLEQLGPQAATFTQEDDRIRLLTDVDRDGVADRSDVFADGFNGLLDGTGAGVLEYNGNVYYTCIPSLYLLRDENGDNRAESREALHTGFGVRVAFRGHDLHGLCIGPDGRLYFSIGDRGANVDTPAGRVMNVESGSVFRCELDGSGLEIFATGLRNPQDLAFDDYGNLFTGDNNSDSGDRARWVYVVEGGDSGWRMAYQYLRDRGPFNRERIWEPLNSKQPAFIVPPVANIADGPSGLDYYPGTGFGDTLQGRFFLVDFRGTPASSGVRSIRNEPDGAFFKLVDDQQPIWNMLATDVQFGPDGAIYVSDWVSGWDGVGKGRIYRFRSTDHAEDEVVDEVRQLLAADFAGTPSETLAAYLGHIDRRVRQKAQLQLASRRDLQTLLTAAKQGSSLLARLHGLWGLDQIARADAESRGEIRACLLDLGKDQEAEVRAHATKLLGELGGGEGVVEAIHQRLADPNPRVRYFALVAARKLGARALLDAVLRVIESDSGHDPILRHGGCMALTTVATTEQLAGLSEHRSEQVRLAAVVALRRLRSPQLTRFLSDRQPQVVLEAARAIHDVPIPEAFQALADLIREPSDDDALLRRVLNANYRLGSARHAQALARYAANLKAPEPMREEALAMLAAWANPGGRDRVLGMWRPLQPRSADVAAEALRPVIGNFVDASSKLRLQVGRMAAELHIADGAPVLQTLLDNPRIDPGVRAEALVALATFVGAEATPHVEAALVNRNAQVRAAALSVVRNVLPDRAGQLLSDASLDGEVVERQTAITALAADPPLVEDLLPVLRQWAAGRLQPELQLEAQQAAEAARADSRVAELLARVDATRDPGSPLDSYREALYGGDAERGRRLFFERTSLSCVRCHKIRNVGGEVGPELTRIGADKSREYLLESIVDPNKTIAEGFESVVLFDESGRVHTGVLRGETDTTITLIDADGNVSEFDKASIEERTSGKSAMPEDLVQHMTRGELRDLVEYLAGLTGRFRFFRRR